MRDKVICHIIKLYRFYSPALVPIAVSILSPPGPSISITTRAQLLNMMPDMRHCICQIVQIYHPNESKNSNEYNTYNGDVWKAAFFIKFKLN